ncbi:NACHT domain-containing protein [Dyadobacter sp. CY323]|uniref:nSTAND1 domain-containing NTPase n=1 Tax=Dyadobacter sp. CY323 TaxID=2907302 RepID=UPI001F1BD88B|nr:NACHT domain-containing protein [Dyadobacter sp. CY323]MCE6990066.1 NACHT domain-containing protein [Dyadobacter sp. CY323]
MVDSSTLANPFPGLRSYEYEDHALFFGRDAHIRELKNKLLDGRFLALIGSSGSGKSSLIKAGLIPSVEESEGGNRWKVVIFRPGSNPVRSFLTALRNALKNDDPSWEHRDSETIEKEIFQDPRVALALLTEIREAKILLVIDQFEELFRYELAEDFSGKSRTTSFVQLLLTLINQRELPVHAVITMRSDYLDHCTEFNGLTEVINKGYYLLPKMNADEVKQVIVGPIESVGATIEPALVGGLLKELSDNPDFLPILQHALMRTWDRWKSTKPFSSPVSVTDYEAIGGIQESISQHAEEIYTQRLDEKRRNAAAKLFKSLIVLGPSDTSSLHPTALREIIQITGIPDYLLIDVILVFRENGVSFLTPKPGIKIDHDSIIDVSVEKILTFWDRCKKWIEEELESAKLYKQLSYSAALYQEGRTGLWVNPELQMGLKWLKESEPTLEWAQRYDPFFERATNFLDYSKKQYELEVRQKEDRQKRELRKARVFASVLGISSLVSLLFLIVALVLRTQAQQSEKTALEKESLALEERKRAEDQTREAISQKKIAEQQGTFAELQKALTEEQKAIAVREQEKAVKESIAAKAAREIAEEQRAQADNARKAAVQSQKETEVQKEYAVSAQKESDRQKVYAQTAQKEAESSRNDALKQRSKAVARFIAIQSFQMPAGDDLAALLALKAYDFNVKNGGEQDNPDIFNALSKAAGAKATLIAHNDIVRAVAEPQATSSLFATAGDDGIVSLWNYLTPSARPVSIRNPRQTFKSIRSLAFMPDGKTIFTGSSNGQIVRWDNFAPGSLPTKTLVGHDGIVFSMSVRNINNKPQLISVSSAGQIRIWDVSDKKMDVLKNLNLGVEVASMETMSDGHYMFLGTGNGKLVRVNLTKLEEKPVEYNFANLRGRLISMAFTPDQKHLYFGTSSGMLYNVRVVNDEPVMNSLNGTQGTHTSGITKIAFAPDGSRIATACYDWKIRIWNAKEDISKQQPVLLSDFDYWVMDIRFSRDGNKLLAAGADKTVRIWDINSADLFAEVLKKAKRELTEEEWDQYIGKDIPYEKLSRNIR